MFSGFKEVIHTKSLELSVAQWMLAVTQRMEPQRLDRWDVAGGLDGKESVILIKGKEEGWGGGKNLERNEGVHEMGVLLF